MARPTLRDLVRDAPATKVQLSSLAIPVPPPTLTPAERRAWYAQQRRETALYRADPERWLRELTAKKASDGPPDPSRGE